ncbi:RNA polymerase sigma factor [Fluviicola chungangensis]|uniref:RNA polymerase sigma factor n=1 Tax=Fluviicola chungangensis TaxID=2597671 RepID=A0A556MIX5_9FLAO|nr:RNA polymerase sigma factor [Fluviicola chungangensis]TSJ39775.1 RNA polymerase sigma factor [Fluviicola chungangensis]
MNSIRPIDYELLKDEEIIDLILNGETTLYELLIRKFNLRLYRISMSIVNDDMEAEDVMQTAYINAYLQLANFQNKSSFGTWLTRIVINESLLYKKKQAKREQLIINSSEKDHQTENNPLKELMNQELKTLLEKAVSDLPEKYRLVFVMREVEELSTQETMDILQLSESNVKVRLNRAKEMLRNDLSTYYKSEQVFAFDLVRCDRIVNFVMSKIADYHGKKNPGMRGTI